ncbi:MAG TPA: CDP-glycerol glycerophosphotransferase family protein [Candidatus Bathyarchaeia archaeon]|nr:CDP-glycerol glycerophosphotransferase family protein [Candidatus Bathyarchaeia archaeon]
MKAWQDWRDYRRFQQLPASDRNIVFYSETHQDWHHLQPLIDVLTGELSRTVCHITSEPTVPFPAARKGLRTFRVRSSVLCTWLFQTLKADVMVLTMLDLHNFQLKRSLHPVHYVYVFHSMGSTHMVDHENSYDHYESLLCTGPHHVAELRRREELKGLRPKHIFPYGYPRLERLVEAAVATPWAPSGATTALLAPTWGELSTLHVCGERLIGALLDAGIRVVLRPHYQTTRLAPRLVEGLVARFGKHPGFRHVDRMEESASLLESDLLISDWSAMAIEYALGLGKPVLFVDVPPRVRNPKYAELGLEPMEMRIRRELGTILPLDRIADAPRYVAELVGQGEEFRARCAALRTEWTFNFGHSAEAGAREIARLADSQAGVGSRGAMSRVS